jgi:branched-chain amino acid aminotransferase
MRREIEFVSMTNYNGQIRATTEAHVPVLDRGFLCGDSIYEVFRTYDGIPLFYDEHWQRFENSAALIHMRIGMSKEKMFEEIRTTIEATGAPSLARDVYVRFIVTRGEGPVDLYPPPDLTTSYVIIVREVPRWNPDYYSRGLMVAVVATRRNPSRALNPNIKGGNYLNNILGIIEAREAGADDCLMLSETGFVTEASNSNVFFVIDDRLVTPSQVAANLRGLTKMAIHEACRAHGLASEEVEIPLEALKGATECFLTSATREVMPVRELRLDDGETLSFPEGGGRTTRRVAEYYTAYVAEYLRTHGALSMF